MIDRKLVREQARVGALPKSGYSIGHTRYVFDTAEALAAVMAAIISGRPPRPAALDRLRDQLRAAGLKAEDFSCISFDFNFRYQKHKYILSMRQRTRERKRTPKRPSRGRLELDRRLRTIDSVFSHFSWLGYLDRSEHARVSAALIAALAPCRES